jgi:hypothetical protein
LEELKELIVGFSLHLKNDIKINTNQSIRRVWRVPQEA